jgi:MinD-like ATPase involved in chromosome partitioning or flagellar assembly
MNQEPTRKTEIIAFASGKGGTGKTSITSALGYALISAGHSVLLVDADPATDGFSLFVLGPKGTDQISSFELESTFIGIVESFAANRKITAVPHRVDRLGSDDHGVSYSMIISGKGLYGAIPQMSVPQDMLSVPVSVVTDYNAIRLERTAFQQAISTFFGQLRDGGQYDYVLVDTRGGFSFESTDVCAAADSFIVVTEANYTSFYQDRSLIDRITEAAERQQTKTLLRAIIVNKATDGQEEKFRAALANEFRIRFQDTFSVALDFDAVKVYKTQQIVYLRAPASQFSFDTLRAFGDILKIVTAQWPIDRVHRWNELVERVKTAIDEHNSKEEASEKEAMAQAQLLKNLRSENEQLRESAQTSRILLEQARNDAKSVTESIKLQYEQAQQTVAREREAAEQRVREKEAELQRLLRFETERSKEKSDYLSERSRLAGTYKTWLMTAVLAVLLMVSSVVALISYYQVTNAKREAQAAKQEAIAARKQAEAAQAAQAALAQKLLDLEKLQGKSPEVQQRSQPSPSPSSQ